MVVAASKTGANNKGNLQVRVGGDERCGSTGFHKLGDME